MLRPTLLTTNAFDASKPKVFTFSVPAGGAQVVANQLTIRLQSDNSVVYQQTQQTFKNEHKLPENTLVNGEYYNADVVVFDALGNSSQPSLAIQFRCYSTPTVVFTNIPDSNIVNNASYNFEFSYDQNEGEALDSYAVNLYNSSRVLIGSSGVIFVEQGVPPYKGSYLYAGLDDGNIYYIELIAKTLNDMEVSTGQVKFQVSYKRPDLFTLLTLKNNCDEGYISVTSNIVLIEGECNPDPPIFIDNKEIDLTDDGAYVEWNKGYVINGDFLARAWFRKPNDYKTIIRFSNTEGQTITVNFMKGYESVLSTGMQSYIQVHVESMTDYPYYIFSNYIDPLSDTEYYCCQLRRINNVYQVGLYPANGGVV